MKKITINGKELLLKYKVRALFIFEELTGYPFVGGKLIDEYLLFYSILLASNPDEFSMTFDEFENACDDNEGLFPAFLEFMADEIKLKQQQFDKLAKDIKKKTGKKK